MKIDSYEIHFDKYAKEVDPSQFESFKQTLVESKFTDIIILAHGWNNNIEDARELYAGLLGKISEAIAAKNDTSKKFVSLIVFWPSKKFTERELIPGNAAGIGDAEEQETQDLISSWAGMKDLFTDAPALAAYEKILKGIKTSKDEEALAPEFLKILSSISSSQENTPFEGISKEEVKVFLADGNLPYLEGVEDEGKATAINTDQTSTEDNSLGLFSGIKQAIANAMNLTTYYTMKNRAGEIGAALNDKLIEIRSLADANLHLAGHSFGARLVTAALFGPKPIEVKTLALVQAAFSHFAFASRYDDINDGFFRSILTSNKIKGALLITHTRADKAVGLAYALASRLAGQNSSATGDKDSMYGGLGGNGAQKTPGIEDKISLAQAAASSLFQAGKTYNLLSDHIIGGHSDIIKTEVGQAIVNAIYV